jgi:hypothetical protein
MTLAMPLARAADPVPEFYGFYALDNGRLTELKASSSNWPNVSATTRFIEFGKGVGAAVSNTHLSRLVFLRAIIDPDSATPERMENRWYRSSNVSRDMELRSKPVVGQPEMIMLVPREALTNGVYSVVRGESVIATFYVNKDAVLANLQESKDCVDHVWEGMGDQFSWDKFDERVRGQHQTILCSQSKLEGMARRSSGGDAAAYENCLSVGNKPEFCEKQYRSAPAKAGSTGQASGAVALGRWTGEIKWGLGTSTASVTIAGLDMGQKVGRTSYTKTRESAPYCEGELTLSEEANGQYVFQEKILRTQGLECPGGGTMRMSVASGGTADAAWDNRRKPGTVGYKGTLNRE